MSIKIALEDNETVKFIFDFDWDILAQIKSLEQVISKAIDGKKRDFEEQESVFSDVLRMMRGKE